MGKMPKKRMNFTFDDAVEGKINETCNILKTLGMRASKQQALRLLVLQNMSLPVRIVNKTRKQRKGVF